MEHDYYLAYYWQKLKNQFLGNSHSEIYHGLLMEKTHPSGELKIFAIFDKKFVQVFKLLFLWL